MATLRLGTACRMKRRRIEGVAKTHQDSLNEEDIAERGIQAASTKRVLYL
jgi:hypothetical protein